MWCQNQCFLPGFSTARNLPSFLFPVGYSYCLLHTCTHVTHMLPMQASSSRSVLLGEYFLGEYAKKNTSFPCVCFLQKCDLTKESLGQIPTRKYHGLMGMNRPWIWVMNLKFFGSKLLGQICCRKVFGKWWWLLENNIYQTSQKFAYV